MKRCVGLLASMILVAALLGGCGSGGSAKSSPAKMDNAGAPGGAQASREAAPAESKPASGPASAQIPDSIDRKIIMNAELNIKIKDADDAIARVSSAIRQAGGYVQETRQQGTRQQGRTMHLTARVPAGRYDNIMTLLAGLGEEVTERREWTQDVTGEYLDLEARIKTRETHLNQLRKLYDKGGSIKEMMELEQEIARVTADLESLKGRYRFLSNQVEFSTITVHLYEPGAPVPVQPPKNVWDRMQHGFVNSWNAMVNVTGDLIVFVVSAVPVVAYLAILSGVAYAVYRGVKRFRRPPSA